MLRVGCEMRYAGRVVCLIAWILAICVQLVVTSDSTPLIVDGVDYTWAQAEIRLHGALLLGIGVAIALLAFIRKPWYWIPAILSPALYLLHWFPFESVSKYGFAAVFEGMAVVGSNPGLRLAFVTRDIILPIAFVLSIVLTLLARRRSLGTTQQI